MEISEQEQASMISNEWRLCLSLCSPISIFSECLCIFVRVHFSLFILPISNREGIGLRRSFGSLEMTRCLQAPDRWLYSRGSAERVQCLKKDSLPSEAVDAVRGGFPMVDALMPSDWG